MILNELRKFQVIAVFLLIACGVLIILSINEKRTIRNNLIKSVSAKFVERKNEVYGYSEIIDLVSKDDNIKVCNMVTSPESKELLRVNIEYKGTLTQLYNTLNSFSSQGCFHSAETVKMEISDKDEQIISADLLFLKNR